MIRSLCSLGVLLPILWVLLSLLSPANARVYVEVTAAQALELLHQNPEAFVIDAGGWRDYVNGHIPGAYSIPHTEISSRKGDLPSTDKTILVYSRSAEEARDASTEVVLLGYTKVFTMTDSFDVWRSNGYPCLVGSERGSFEVPPTFKDVTCLAVLELLHADPTSLVIDASSLEEYVNGHISGAYHVPPDEIITRGRDLCIEQGKTENSVIIIYARSAQVSADASGDIASLGFANVYNMKEGFDVWRGSGYPYTTGSERGSFQVTEPLAAILALACALVVVPRNSASSARRHL